MEWVIGPAVILYYIAAFLYGLVLQHEQEIDVFRHIDLDDAFRQIIIQNRKKPRPVEFDWRKEGF
jgi:hypothetical protein